MTPNSRSYLNRWIQPDTDVPESQGVQALDRYAYVNNSPVNYMDPTGHMLSKCPDGACDGDLHDDDPNFKKHTASLGNITASPLEPIGGDVPDYSPAPISNPLVWLLTVLGLAKDGYEMMQQPGPNISTFLTYSEGGDGSLSDFNYSVLNNSDTNFYVSSANFNYHDWRKGFTESPLHAPNQVCFASINCPVLPKGREWLGTSMPSSSGNIPLSSGNPNTGLPFDNVLSVQVRVDFMSQSATGLIPGSDQTTIYGPRGW